MERLFIARIKASHNHRVHVSIGHNAIVHGCVVKDNVLIGMGAIVMDNCVIESNRSSRCRYNPKHNDVGRINWAGSLPEK
jgi:NDP-sugar pyrophosphorylase family protein